MNDKIIYLIVFLTSLKPFPKKKKCLAPPFSKVEKRNLKTTHLYIIPYERNCP